MKWSLKGIKLQVTHSHYIIFFFIFYIFKLMEKEKAPCVVVPNSAPMWPGLHLVQAFILRDCPCFFLAKLFYSVGLLGRHCSLRSIHRFLSMFSLWGPWRNLQLVTLEVVCAGFWGVFRNVIHLPSSFLLCHFYRCFIFASTVCWNLPEPSLPSADVPVG